MYPEHDKLKLVKTESQAIGEFLHWLSGNNIILCGLGDDDYPYLPIYLSTEKLLAQFFKINLDKLENEKIEMFEEQRKLNRKS